MAKKGAINNLVQSIVKVVEQNDASILAGLGIAGMIASVGLAIKEGPKIHKILEESKEKELTPLETAKELAPAVLPVAAVTTASALCVVGSNVKSARKYAALSAVYNITESRAREWADKTKEVVGEKNFEKIHDAICEDKVKASYPNGGIEDGTEVIITGHGNTLCYESFTGKYFRSNPEHIRKVINDMNQKMFSENYVTYNEMLSEFGLDRCKYGEQFGWNIENGQIEPWFSSMLTDDNQPVLCIDFNAGPVWMR